MRQEARAHYELGSVAEKRAPGRIEHWLAARLLAALGSAPIAIRLWSGEQMPASDATVACLRIHDPAALWRLCLDPELQFGELYREGRLSVEGDLVALLEAAMRAPSRGLAAALSRLRGRQRQKDLGRSRRNARHHYDLGNDFYRLWLDAGMSYTCAYFASPGMSLEDAQAAKADLVCRKLRLTPGQRVVEAGGGWGGLALHMARHYGVEVTSYNVSAEQVRYASDRARRARLDDRVRFVEDDYRNICGEFDAFVSVGMLEHVGRPAYAELGHIVDRCLGPHGLALIHTIGRSRPRPLNPWIRRRIFPGAYPPTLREMNDIFEPCDFSVLDVENLRLHYATTLEHWLRRFESAADVVRASFDEVFERSWRLYLSGSMAAFRVGSLHLFQVVFTRSSNNRVPLTRADLYASLPGTPDPGS